MIAAIEDPAGKPNRDMNMTAQQTTFDKTRRDIILNETSVLKCS